MGNVRILAVLLALLVVAGCKERLEEGAAAEKAETAKEKKRAVRAEGKINIDGKLYPAAPAGVSETYCLVDGKQVPARWVKTKCENGQCVLYVEKDSTSATPAENRKGL